MVQEIRTIVKEAYIEVLTSIFEQYPNDFLPLIARGEYYEHGIKGISNYMLDYMGDIYRDKTRQKFYEMYLNKNYLKEGFYYTKSGNGFFDLNIEIMIFSQIWESTYFLKFLVRIAIIISGGGYKWEKEIPSRDLFGFIKNNIIVPLERKNFKLGSLLRDNYNSKIRNAFAHSQYDIDMNSQMITFTYLDHNEYSTEEVSFEKFQSMFLHAIILDNFSLGIIQDIGKWYLQNGYTNIGVVQLPNNKFLHIKIRERLGQPDYYTEKQ